MSEFMDILTIIDRVVSSGSDIALIAIALAIWRVERRVFKLELKFDNLRRYKNE